MQYKTFQLKDILERQPKSQRKAGDGLTAGAYPFFTSSPVQSKWLDDADYDKPSVILGTGGGPSIHFATQFSTSTDVFVFSPKSASVMAEYIRYFLSAHMDLLEKGFKGAGLKHISSEYVLKLPIRLPVQKDGNPDLKEQQRIVALMRQAEALKEKRILANQTMADVVPALFVKMFGNPATNPMGWKNVLINEVCTIGDGNHSGNYPKADQMVSSGVPFIRATNLKNGLIDDSDLKFITPEKHEQLKKGHLKKGDILFSNRGEIGKLAIVQAEYDGSNLNSQLAWFRPGSELTSDYLIGLLSSRYYQHKFKAEKQGAALQQYTIRQINSLSILLPPITLQREYAGKIQEMRAIEKFQRESKMRVENLYTALLSKSFV